MGESARRGEKNKRIALAIQKQEEVELREAQMELLDRLNIIDPPVPVWGEIRRESKYGRSYFPFLGMALATSGYLDYKMPYSLDSLFEKRSRRSRRRG